VRKEGSVRRIPIVFFLLLVAGGCAATPRKPVWVPAEGAFAAPKSGYSVVLPAGWTRVNREERLLITRDGSSLQFIGVATYKVGTPLQHTKKKCEKGMLPQELADILIDDIASTGNVASVEVLENAPARIGDVEGFRVVCRIRFKGGLDRKCAFYGAMRGDRVFDVYYTAAARHYFDRDLGVFEEVARSFRFMPPP